MGTSLYENSNYSGKGSASIDFHREEKTEKSNKYGQMKKVFEVAEELEEARAKVDEAEAALTGAQEYVKEVEKKLRREVRKLDPETRARFMAILGDDVGPGGEDR